MLRLWLLVAAVLVLVVVQVTPAGSASSVMDPQTTATKALDDSSTELAQLDSIYAQTMQTEQKLATLYHDLDQKAVAYEKVTETGSTSAAVADAAKQLQQTEISTNQQYLALQHQMQQEDQEFTTVSNIMKSKHDAAKNAVQNIR